MRQRGGDMGQLVYSRTTQHECCLLQSATKGQSEPNIREEFDVYLHQLGSFDAYLCPSGRFMSQMTITTFLDTRSTCPDCGTLLKLKARGSRSFRTLFGTFTFSSPRLEHCDCTRHQTASFRPLSALLTESVAPELLYMEAKWSSLVSYGMSLDALQDFLPLALSLDVKTVRYDTLKVAKRLEAELGEEQASCIEGDPSAWELLPLPDGSFKVGIDGGYVRNWVDKKHHFEVIVGKSMLSFGEGEEDRPPS